MATASSEANVFQSSEMLIKETLAMKAPSEPISISDSDNGEFKQETLPLPDSARLDVPSFNQQELGLATGCEIVSLSMMINYSVFVDIDDLVDEMPRSLDPNLGFTGNPSTTSGFTVFPSALEEVTEDYLDNAIDMTGGSMEDIKEQLSNDSPVVAWINGLGWNVHAITISGYDENGFYYNDPWTGGKDTFITYNAFYDIWNKPIYDKRYNISYSTRKALSYTRSDFSFEDL